MGAGGGCGRKCGCTRVRVWYSACTCADAQRWNLNVTVWCQKWLTPGSSETERLREALRRRRIFLREGERQLISRTVQVSKREIEVHLMEERLMERERETRREEKEIRVWKEGFMRREVEIDARERDLWWSGVGKGMQVLNVGHMQFWCIAKLC